MRPTTAGIVAPLLAAVVATVVSTPTLAGTTDSVSVAIQIHPAASIEFPDGTHFALSVPRDDGHGHGHDDDDDDHDDDRDRDDDRHHKDGRGKDHDDRRDHDRDGDDRHRSDRDDDRDRSNDGKDHDDDDDRDVGRSTSIRPVQIRFKVRGNAQTLVSALPSSFMRIHHGPSFGKATKEDDDRHRNQNGNGHSSQHGSSHGHSGKGELGYNVIVQFPVSSWHQARLPALHGYGTSVPPGYASLPGENGVGTAALTADAAGRRYGVSGMIYIVAKQNWTADGRDAAPGTYRGMVEVTVTAGEH